MPGLELFGSSKPIKTTTIVELPSSEPTTPAIESIDAPRTPGAYYNPRLDPKNYLKGPLSLNPATRLRQMLARPGIVVCLSALTHSHRLYDSRRLPRVSAMVSVHGVRLRLVSLAYTRGTHFISAAAEMSKD